MNAPAVRGNIRLGQPLGFHFSTWIVILDRLGRLQKTAASAEKSTQEAVLAKMGLHWNIDSFLLGEHQVPDGTTQM